MNGQSSRRNMLLPVREVFYVIARYKEDVSWAKKFKKFIVQKDIHVPNVGREASSYLWYIVNNYYKLDDLVAYQFCQGRSHDHKISFFNFCCDLSGNPHHPGLLIEKFAKKIDLNIPENLYFTVGAQFKVLGKQIKKDLCLGTKMRILHLFRTNFQAKIKGREGKRLIS